MGSIYLGYKKLALMNFIKILTLTLAIGLFGFALFAVLESSSVFAVSASDQVVVSLNVDTGISITSPADTYMSTSLGVSTNQAVATTTWNVKTNNSLGYSLTVLASTNPAMQSGGNRIDDYATTTMPSTWSVPAGNAKFGFSVYGTDVNTTTWGTASSCSAATSTPNTTLKYYGFYTVATSVATRSSTTTTAGIDTVVCYAVEQDTYYIPSGVYTATITATATTL